MTTQFQKDCKQAERKAIAEYNALQEEYASVWEKQDILRPQIEEAERQYFNTMSKESKDKLYALCDERLPLIKKEHVFRNKEREIVLGLEKTLRKIADKYGYSHSLTYEWSMTDILLP